MNIFNISKKYNFYKLLHPLTLLVSFPIVFTALCFLTKSPLLGFVIYALILISLILISFLNMLLWETALNNVISFNFSKEVAGKPRDSFKDNVVING